MKRVTIVIAAVIIGLLIWAGLFYWNNLRGSGPAFRDANKNITEFFNEGQETTRVPGKNRTDFPLSIPDGFTLSIFAQNLGKARDLQKDPENVLLVSSTDKGIVYALPDNNADGTVDETKALITGLNQPHGLELDCMNRLLSSTNNPDIPCALYVAEETMVGQFEYNPNDLSITNKQILTPLPAGGRHSTRSIVVSPRDRNELLISIGSTCDTCVEKNPMHGSVQALNIQTKELKPFATGLRNSVFLALRPNANEVWATEMGRDQLGDNLPPDEINILKEGGNYGWPYAYGKNIEDKTFRRPSNGRIEDTYTIPSHIDLPAHSAPLGLTFIPENSEWPEEYWGNLLVAYHGSWNRTEPTGYKIVRIILDEKGNKTSEEDFITGWLDGNSSLGRPVDLLATDKGELYISDDKAGVVYLLKKM